jgi:hypothetical protein
LPGFRLQEPVRIEPDLIRKNGFPFQGQPLNGTNGDIDAQKHQQQQKPPGMIHVMYIKYLDQVVDPLPVKINILLRRSILEHHGSDNRRHCQENQKIYG